MRRALRGLAALAVLSIAAAGALGGAFLWALGPVDPLAGDVRFEVPAGATLDRVATELERAGLVRSRLALVALARWRGDEGRLHAGEYAFSAAWGARRILDWMVEGHVVTYPLVVPEGLSAAEIAQRVEAAGFGPAAAFLALARDPALARELGVGGDGLEGYLFPETYSFARGTPPRAIAKAMVGQFLAVWRDIEPEARARGLSMREAATLASIVEKETGAAVERPLVASVFTNRLARGMRLESDPTTIYGIEGFDGNLTRAHLEDETNAWNTYRIAGLPPTPIANAGEASLRAVVRPAPSDYLFFVSRNDGTHVFARSFAEHVRNVNEYQRRRPAR